MTLQNYRPDENGTLVPAPPATEDYRSGLRSRRWDAAELANPEADTTNPWIAVAAILFLGALTFGILVVGYSTGFWG